MKYATARPYADPEKPRAGSLRSPTRSNRFRDIHIEKINEPFLFSDRGSPTEYGAGLRFAIDRGWLKLHKSGTFVTFTPEGRTIRVMTKATGACELYDAIRH